MARGQKAIAAPKPITERDQAATLTYNAWLSAIQDGCECRSCVLLRQLTKFMPPVPIPQEVDYADQRP